MKSSHVQNAQKNYRRFHGRAVQKKSSVDFTAPKALTLLGTGVAIEYESNKRLHNTHRPRLYRHKFGRHVKIYLHPNGRWLLLSGGHFRVTDWMRD